MRLRSNAVDTPSGWLYTTINSIFLPVHSLGPSAKSLDVEKQAGRQQRQNAQRLPGCCACSEALQHRGTSNNLSERRAVFFILKVFSLCCISTSSCVKLKLDSHWSSHRAEPRHFPGKKKCVLPVAAHF